MSDHKLAGGVPDQLTRQLLADRPELEGYVHLVNGQPWCDGINHTTMCNPAFARRLSSLMSLEEHLPARDRARMCRACRVAAAFGRPLHGICAARGWRKTARRGEPVIGDRAGFDAQVQQTLRNRNRPGGAHGT